MGGETECSATFLMTTIDVFHSFRMIGIINCVYVAEHLAHISSVLIKKKKNIFSCKKNHLVCFMADS